MRTFETLETMMARLNKSQTKALHSLESFSRFQSQTSKLYGGSYKVERETIGNDNGHYTIHIQARSEAGGLVVFTAAMTSRGRIWEDQIAFIDPEIVAGLEARRAGGKA